MFKASNFFGTLFRLLTGSLINLFILLIVGGLTGLLTFQIVNQFTESSLGVNNIIILVAAFTFFPLLNSLFVIFLVQENRKKYKNKKLKKKSHLELAE